MSDPEKLKPETDEIEMDHSVVVVAAELIKIERENRKI